MKNEMETRWDLVGPGKAKRDPARLVMAVLSVTGRGNARTFNMASVRHEWNEERLNGQENFQ